MKGKRCEVARSPDKMMTRGNQRSRGRTEGQGVRHENLLVGKKEQTYPHLLKAHWGQDKGGIETDTIKIISSE